MRLHERIHGELIKRLTASNVERQLSLLRDLVEISLAIKDLRVDGAMVKWLHGHVTTGLVDGPGAYRDHNVFLRATGFEPPPHQDIKKLMGDFFPELHKRWNNERHPYLVAAYALWRLCWIHPFEDGNGRTARAVA